MPSSTKHTSAKMAKMAAETLRDPNASAEEKSIAGSALAQVAAEKETGANVEKKAAKVLHDPKASKKAKSMAASVVSQSSKEKR